MKKLFTLFVSLFCFTYIVFATEERTLPVSLNAGDWVAANASCVNFENNEDGHLVFGVNGDAPGDAWQRLYCSFKVNLTRYPKLRVKIGEGNTDGALWNLKIEKQSIIGPDSEESGVFGIDVVEFLNHQIKGSGVYTVLLELWVIGKGESVVFEELEFYNDEPEYKVPLSKYFWKNKRAGEKENDENGYLTLETTDGYTGFSVDSFYVDLGKYPQLKIKIADSSTAQWNLKIKCDGSGEMPYLPHDSNVYGEYTWDIADFLETSSEKNIDIIVYAVDNDKIITIEQLEFFNPDGGGGTTGNKQLNENSFLAYSQNGQLIIQSDTEKTVSIYDISGKLVDNFVTKLNTTAQNLQPGLYIVKSEDGIVKVLVK